MNADYEGNVRTYDIEICGKHYTTSSLDIISDADDEDIYSSGTRIFKAFGVDENGVKETYVIKDFWPIDYCETEDVRQRRMLDDICDPKERELVKKHILTPIASERVKVGDKEDHTKNTILRGENPNAACKVVLPDDLKGKKGDFYPTNAWIDVTEDPSPDMIWKLELGRYKAYLHRWHYRIVYKEVAIPYRKLSDLRDMSLVVEHSIEG